MEQLEKVQVESTQKGKLDFSHFPAFAAFIKDNYLIPYIQEQLRISKDINLPLLKYFKGVPMDEMIAIAIPGNKEFLEYVANNKLEEQIEAGIKRWVSDEIGIIKKDQVAAEDITLGGYMRKKALLKFLPSYTNDVLEAIEIANEIDTFTIESLTRSTNVYIDLLRARIYEQTHFSESISDVTPGLNYVFGLREKQIKYANKNYLDHFGYTLQQLQQLGPGIVPEFLHPDDLANHKDNLRKCKELRDKEVHSWEYRLKDHTGRFRWMRNYASVFKRDHTGNVSEIIGIILDIDTEKKTSDKLSQSEQNLVQAQALSHIGNWYWKLDTNEVTWSDELWRIYGLQPESGHVQPEISRMYRHPDDVKAVDEHMKRLREEHIPCDYNYRIVLPNGTIKHINVKGEVAFDKQGKATAILGTVQEITERQTLIEQLQHSDALYKQAQAISHIGNWMWDMSTKKMEWSDELYHIYELEPGTLTDSAYAGSFNHPEDKQLVDDMVAHTVKTGEPFDFYYRIVLKNGKVKILHAIGEIEKKNNSVGPSIFGTLQDVTEQKHAEKQLKEYKDFIEKVTDVTPSIIASYNVNTGKFSFINDGIEKELGYPVSMVMELGVPFMASIVHPDDVNALMEQNNKALEEANKVPTVENEPVVEFKYRMRNKDGAYRWFHTYGTIFERNEKGLVESVLNISVDITGEEIAQQALQLNNLQLQQSNSSLEEYAYVASHDLKEPLRKIATFADRLVTTHYDSLNDDGKNYLNKIIESSRRMQKLISDLLSVSTILGNKAFESCNLGDVLKEALQQLDQKIEESNAIVQADKLPVVSVVPSQFRQLFQNLIGNALKFSRMGVPPVITITHEFLDPNAAGQYDLIKAKRYLKIDIADNGIGFDNQYAAKIFTIFQRLHNKADYEGTGIGLAVCKKIIENHGGVIFATGIPDKSAIFTLIIPI